MATIMEAPHMVDNDDNMIALSMQMEELGFFAQQLKGKHPIDNPPDLEIAFRDFQSELEGYKVFLEDQKLAQSIGNAVHTDGALVSAITSRDVQILEDRRAAIALYERDPELQRLTLQETDADSIDEYLASAASVAGASVIYDSNDDESDSGPSTTFREHQADALERLSRTFVCVACREKVRAAVFVEPSCGDRYCVPCARELFLRSIKDEPLFPPRCCRQPIPPSYVVPHMTQEEKEAFELATVEFETVDRVYCGNLRCSTFLRPSTIDAATQRVYCNNCSTFTCIRCKHEAHAEDECPPEDTDLIQTRILAQQEGWQTCYRCSRLVLLRTGCNHMTCHCKAEFCYVCGTAWKNCRCVTADMNRMVERAEEVVDREPGLPLFNRQQRVQEVHERLLENHECTHPGRFQRICGTGRRKLRCEFCEARHWRYILECRHCSVRVCEDCRRNRI